MSKTAKYPHEFLLTRIEKCQLDAGAIVTIESELENSDDVWREFKSAVTQWVETTDAGSECWDESCENLNVGDLLNNDAFNDPELRTLLAWRGLTVTATSLNEQRPARMMSCWLLPHL